MSEIIVSTLEKAVTDGISLLTRCRFHRTAPFYLVHPQRPLRLTVVSIGEPTRSGIRTAVVEVRCITWNDTVVTFNLSEKNGYWLVWGPFTIVYDLVGYPIRSLQGNRVDTKSIYPAFADRNDYARPMEYRIRSSAR